MEIFFFANQSKNIYIYILFRNQIDEFNLSRRHLALIFILEVSVIFRISEIFGSFSPSGGVRRDPRTRSCAPVRSRQQQQQRAHRGTFWPGPDSSSSSSSAPASPQCVAENFIRFCFCLWLQNQTRTTFFFRSSFSAMAAIFSEEGRGCTAK